MTQTRDAEESTAGNVDPTEAAMNMMEMEVGEDDTEDTEDIMSTSDMMAQMMGEEGDEEGPRVNPQPPEVVASRRQLNWVLQNLHIGATGKPVKGMPDKPEGLFAMAKPDQQAAVQAWVEMMEPIVDAINDPELDDRRKYMTGLQEQIDAIENVAKADEGAKADAAADDELNRLLSN